MTILSYLPAYFSTISIERSKEPSFTAIISYNEIDKSCLNKESKHFSM